VTTGAEFHQRAGHITRRTLLQGAVTLAGVVAADAARPAERAVAATSPVPASRVPSGTLTVSLPARIVGLDPLGPDSAEDSVRLVATHIYDSLVIRSPRSAAYLPSLAVKWETPDPLTWVFTLRPGAKFSDGTPVTAGDVKGSLERLVALRGPLAPLWTSLDSVDAPNDATVRIKTKAPLGTMLPNLTLLSIVPVAKVDQPSFFQNKPIGSGAFRVVSYQPDNELVLEANAAYWGPAPGVKTLQFKDIPEVAARVTALITGEIDLTYNLPPDQIATLQQNREIRVTSTPSFRYYQIWMNIKREPFTDKRVRQAMAYALDVDTMVATLMKGVGRRMAAPVPSTAFGYAPQRPFAYNPTMAKQLLAAAGHPDGFECAMAWNPGSGPQDRELAQAFVSYWGAIGVKVRDDQQERSIWIDRLLKLDWDLNFFSNGDTTGDADFALRRLYTTQANRTGYANPQLDQILNAAAATVDQTQRRVLYAEACGILWDDVVGIWPIELIFAYAYRQGVEGFTATPGVPNFSSLTVRR